MTLLSQFQEVKSSTSLYYKLLMSDIIEIDLICFAITSDQA